jgi:CheY-like chemotaxis protein
MTDAMEWLAYDTVLVVDDEVLVRLAIADYLRTCGFRVIEAANGDEALLILEQPDIGVSVVLSDVEMPGAIDGFALANWVRANRPDLRFLLAGSPLRAARQAGDLCQSGPMLAKPYDPAMVVDWIRRMLARRKPSMMAGVVASRSASA